MLDAAPAKKQGGVRTRSMHMPKLPFVSYSRIFSLPASKSHTLMRPSEVVPARY